MIPFTPSLSSPISSPEGTYHYTFSRLGPYLSVISSDDHIRILDPTTLQIITTTFNPSDPSFKLHDGITCLTSFDGENDPNLLLTAGRDGSAKLWDLRQGISLGRAAGVFKRKDGGQVLSLAVCKDRGIAVGTELTGVNAEVVVWDFDGREKMSYVESHNDDITQLSFHPTLPLLLSGSTDGLINIYNLTIPEEDDALHQVINHGSIHRANFLTQSTIFALSHDEKLSVHKLADEDDSIEPRPVVFGDIREKLGCDYAVDLLLRGEGGAGILAVGSHEEGWVDLHSLSIDRKGTWALGGEDAVRLVGGHRGEVVRCIYVDMKNETVYTGGEDGLVKAWRASS
ncbi:hypothetical protein TWF481_001695 [Arthrobotrys musiformis]|uniref:WD40 repeat-like protein n=1 Tax=Arthrobotrys musiformis TaxID=47236 RepID=A0AAV9VTZ1_9PEZI